MIWCMAKAPLMSHRIAPPLPPTLERRQFCDATVPSHGCSTPGNAGIVDGLVWP